MLERPVRHLKRYRQIARVLTRHGMGFLVEQAGLADLLALPSRLLRRSKSEERFTKWERVRMALEELGPAFVKLGQILSIRPDLVPPPLIRELEKLQDEVSAFPPDEVREQVRRELGAEVEDLFDSFEMTSLAAASIGQVHRARLKSGEEVVLKLQRPGIERTIQTDLEILREIASIVQRRSPWGRIYQFVDTVDELAESIQNELDFTAEGRNAEQLRQRYKHSDEVIFPRVYWSFTSRRVLTLEFLEGTKLGDPQALREIGASPRLVAETVVRNVLKQIFVDGFFHADPHPGNVAVSADGRLIFYDMGMVGRLGEETKRTMANLSLAVVRRRPADIARGIVELGVVGRQANLLVLQRDIERIIDRYAHVPLREFHAGEAMRLIMELAFKHHIRIPTDLTMMAKALVTLEGVMRRLDPTLSIMDVAQPFARSLIRERLSVRSLRRGLTQYAGDYVDLLRVLPRQVTRLLEQAEQGELRLRLSIDDSARLVQMIGVLVNRLSITILVASLILGTALIADQERTMLARLPLAELGFLLALLLGVRLGIAILRSGKF